MKLFTTLLSSFFVIEIHSQAEANPGEATKEVIRQWVETEKILSSEKEGWKEKKAHLSELLELYAKELTLLNEELAAVPSIEMDDKKKESLEKQSKEADRSRTKLKGFLLAQKTRVLALVEKFPDPLQDQINESVLGLKSTGNEASARDLLMPMLSIMDAGSSFNAGVYRTSQKVSIGDEDWQAEVMYLGLGQSYFWIGEKAGTGYPSADGWKWERNDGIIEEVKKAMAVFDGKTQPQLIKLPLKVN